MHSTDNLEDGYMGSGKKLRRSLNKYGEDNFKFEIMEFLPNRKLLSLRESELVNEELLKDPLSMNLKNGGEGGLVNDEHGENLKKGASKYQKNKWLSDNEYRDKITKLLLEQLKKNHLLGKINYNTFEGKKHTEETKKKMSDSKKGMYDGKNNPSYETCWITNGIENKKIKKVELNSYICDGWYKGRII
jgi:hypothetical protein